MPGEGEEDLELVEHVEDDVGGMGRNDGTVRFVWEKVGVW
jgi:hypothetical protein